jgi:hypothetical protein
MYLYFSNFAVEGPDLFEKGAVVGYLSPKGKRFRATVIQDRDGQGCYTIEVEIIQSCHIATLKRSPDRNDIEVWIVPCSI